MNKNIVFIYSLESIRIGGLGEIERFFSSFLFLRQNLVHSRKTL